MPENETLFPDARTANRWQPFQGRFARGDSPEQVFCDFQAEFYRALRRVFREWAARGVAPEQLFDAAVNDPQLLRQLVDQTWNHEYAQLLQDAAQGEPGANLETVIRSFLDSAWEQIRSHLQIDCLENGPPDSFLTSVDQMLARLLRALLEDRSQVPRRPPRKKPPDIGDILGESLPLA